MQSIFHLPFSSRQCFPLLRQFGIAFALISPLAAQSNANVSISLNSTQLRRAIPNDFMGLSLEMSAIEAANNNGVPWLSGTSTAYSAMVQKIGVGSIRIGGNSSERQPYATAQDGANVDAFVNLIGANLIWAVPVKQFYDQSTSVSYVQGLYTDQHVNHNYNFPTNIEVGNEPDNSEDVPGSAISQSTWQSRYDGFSSAFRSQINSGILSTGPSTAGCCTFSTDFINDPTYQGSLKSTIGFVTTHYYPLGDAGQYTTVGAFDGAMLTPALDSAYQSYYSTFNDNASNSGYNVRWEETNSAYQGDMANGNPPLAVSDTYAAALWAMDYFCYMAYNTNMEGMNLHNGPIGSNSYNAIYPVGAASSYTLMGPGYGMWAFHYGSQGQPLTTTLTNPSNVNVAAYGLLESNGGETVHIINKTSGSLAYNVTATITPTSGYAYAAVIILKQANNDITQTTGITFGGQPMNSNGTWTGGYGPQQNLINGSFTFTLPAAQAAIVHFYN